MWENPINSYEETVIKSLVIKIFWCVNKCTSVKGEITYTSVSITIKYDSVFSENIKNSIQVATKLKHEIKSTDR